MEGLTEDLVAAISDELERRVDGGTAWAALAERKDLEPSAVDALTPAFGQRVEKDRKVSVPHWASVGHADLLVRDASRADRLRWVAELKWCRPEHDILYELIWDMFKMALVTSREDHPTAYLIAGAERSMWETSAFADLFDDATHDTVESARVRCQIARRR